MTNKIHLKNSHVILDTIMMGTWQADSSRWPHSNKQSFVKTLQAAYDEGIRCFDTAEVYGHGLSEQLIASALGPHRPSMMIASKVFSNHLHYDGVIAACERSLKHLQTDYIDLYQIHGPSGGHGSKEVPIAETMDALNHLQQQGKIRAIGVSNFSAQQLNEACAYGTVVSNQIPFSLLWQSAYHDIQSYCQDNNIAILAYSPLAQGLLTGRFKVNHPFMLHDIRRKCVLFKEPYWHDAINAVDVLQKLADQQGMSLIALVIAWVLSHQQTVAIMGATNSTQGRYNASLMKCQLSESEYLQVSQVVNHFASTVISQSSLWN